MATAKTSVKFKPARARCNRLKIGDWSYSAPHGSSKTDFEAKFLFSRKRLVWEWKLHATSKRKIEVTFASVDQIYADNNNGIGQSKLFIVVKSAPTLFNGTISNNQPTKWSPADDFTNGSYLRSSLHELDLAVDANALNVILQTLGDFSPNFREMLSRRVFGSGSRAMASVIGGEPPAKRIRSTSSETPLGVSLSGLEKAIAVHPEKATPSRVSSAGCSCAGICDAFSCPCSISLKQCSSRTCKCIQECCQNPLSLLAANGVPLNRLRDHRCLNDNLFYHPERKPHQLLFTRVQLPCCKSEIALIHALATGIRCRCGTTWNFSFCRRALINESDPQCFHCPKCKVCQNIDAKHCDVCGICSSRAKPCSCSKLPPGGTLKLSGSVIEDKFSPMGLFDDDEEQSLVVSPALTTDSPASVSSLSAIPFAAKINGNSFSDLSPFSKAMLGLGQGPDFFKEVQSLLKSLYS